MSVYRAVPTPARINTIVNSCPAWSSGCTSLNPTVVIGRDRLVQGVHDAEAEDDVPNRAHHHDPGQGEEADEDVANPPHRCTVPAACGGRLA